MTTVCVQIGNGDDKLTQVEWHEFVVAMKEMVAKYCSKLHFFGAPENWHEQQNVAFIFDVDEAAIPAFKKKVMELRKHFRQESVAWTAGRTEFI